MNSNLKIDDSNLKIPGYNLVRSDHPSNKKRGGVCTYYKSYLLLRIIDINYLNECVRFELMVADKLCIFMTLYRFPSQSQGLFESFKENLELNFEFAVQNNPFLVVLLDDFNAKSSKNNITTTEGKAIENISSQFGLHQMINEPTHILESSSLCNDLTLTSQPNLITESGVHPSLHPNSHHQIIFAKFNLEIHYPPLYFRDVWHYQDANTDLTRRAIAMFDWDRAFVNTNVNEKVFILNKTLNIL